MKARFSREGELTARIDALVERHFPWEGTRYRTREGKGAAVHAWLRQQTLPYQAVATGLIARVVPILAAVQQRLPAAGQSRFLYRIDSSHIVKGPESILEKMARLWLQLGGEGPPISFHNLQDMKDLGRFRIVANFLSDAEVFRARLEAPFNTATSHGFSADEQRLRREFTLRDNRFEDLVRQPPDRRKSGERCLKAHFSPKSGEFQRYSVEVQIMTALQEAWDKKDHFLLYERRRAGTPVPEEHHQLSYSLSEKLYLADYLFDRLKQEVEQPAAAPALARRKRRPHAPSP